MKDKIIDLYWEYSFPIRKFFFKLKMLKRFYKHLYTEWEYTEAMFHIPMEMFKNFYEECVLDSGGNRRDWSYNSEEYKMMQEIYDYYIRVRPAYVLLEEMSLSSWSEYHNIEFIEIEGTDYGEIKSSYREGFEEYGRILNKLHWKYSEFTNEKDLYYLQELAKLKNFMWE